VIHLSSLSPGDSHIAFAVETEDLEPGPGAPRPGASQLEPRAQQSWAERIWWTIAGIAILNFAIGLLGDASAFPWLAAFVVVGGAWGLGTITVSFMQFGQSPQIRRLSNRLAWATALLLLAMFAAWAFVQVHNSPAYGTDELAFDQYAAQLVQHGMNPYVHSMDPSFYLFRVSPDGWTYTLTGQAVTQFSYPSLAFLVYLPFLILGWSHELGVGLNLIAWGASILLMFHMFPRNMRAAALVIGLVDCYISNAVGGVTDVLYMPLLIIAAYRWDRFGLDRRSYIAPVMVGLAMAIKQTPWPLLLFVLLALACDEYARAGIEPALRRAGRYLAVVLATFFLVNLPFILMSPSAWVTGTLTPLVKNMVPSGQGTVAFTLFLHFGGGSLFAFTLATVFMALMTLVAYVGTYPLLRPATVMLPALIYFFASRSQTNYLIALIPVAVVWAVSAGAAPQPARSARGFDGALLEAGVSGRSSRALLAWIVGPNGPVRSLRWAQAIAASALLFVIATIYSLTAPAPLSMAITGVQLNGILGVVQQATVLVTNTSSSQMRPAFTVEDGRGLTTFWKVAQGPPSLAPGQTANYRIYALNSGAEPSLGGGFTVLAFGNNPGTVSASNRYLPALMHLTFSPQAFTSEVPVGRAVTIKVQLVGHLNETADRPHVKVYLTQAIYTGLGKSRPSAIINGRKAGKRSVFAYTNSQGIATFHIIGTKASELGPTAFNAHLVNTAAGFQYGVTGALTVWFSPPKQ
jgi:uncharacterized membrane protein